MFLSRLVVVAASALAPALVFATPLTGTFTAGSNSDAIVSATAVNFTCSGTVVCPGNTGDATVNPNGTGDFFVPTGTTVTAFIADLGVPATPIGIPFLLTNWETFTGILSDAALDLRFIFPGTDPTSCGAADQHCTPIIGGPLVNAGNPLGLSAFNLDNTAAGSSASFDVSGTARRISTGEVSNFVAHFSSDFNVPFQQVLAQLAATGTVTSGYSEKVTVTFTPTPEPGSMFLLLGGGLVIAATALRKKVGRA
jgi:hypothetical protein